MMTFEQFIEKADDLAFKVAREHKLGLVEDSEVDEAERVARYFFTDRPGAFLEVKLDRNDQVTHVLVDDPELAGELLGRGHQ